MLIFFRKILKVYSKFINKSDKTYVIILMNYLKCDREGSYKYLKRLKFKVVSLEQ